MAAIIRGHDLNEVSNDRFNYIKDKIFRKSIVNYTFNSISNRIMYVSYQGLEINNSNSDLDHGLMT